MSSNYKRDEVTVNLRKKGINDRDNIFNSLNEKESIVELDLGENSLTRLPDNLSAYRKLVYLDISNNPFENYQEIGKALASIPQLRELKIDLFSQEHAHCILSQLPHLNYLNDNPTKEDQNALDVEEKELDSTSLKNEIPNFQVKLIKSILKRLEKKLKGSKETIDFFYMEFEKILKTQIDIINSIDHSVSNFLYSATALQSKVEIYSHLQNKAINMLSGQVDYEVISILKDINGFIKANETNTIELFKKITPKFEVQCSNETTLREELSNKNKVLNSRIIQMQKTIEDKDINIHDLSEHNTMLQTQMKEMKMMILKEKEQSQLQQSQLQVNQYSQGPNQHQHQKQQQLQKGIKPTDVKTLNKSTNEDNSQRIESSGIRKRDLDSKPQLSQVINKTQNRNNQSDRSLSSSLIASQQESQQGYISTNNNNNNNSSNHPTSKKNSSNNPIAQINGKVLSKKALLETISEIYQSKVLYDKKCDESQLPRETMEQHMYTYLNYKYGLKNIIIEWATGIINGIRLYSLEDSEVCLFGKILRNEIEERSLAVFDKVKSTINDFMLYYLQKQYSFKNKGEIQQMLTKLKCGFLSEEEWINITEYIFDNPAEKQSLNDRIYSFIQKGESRTWSSANRQGKPITKEEQQILDQVKTSNEILYNDFIQLILDFQIRLRDRYLKPFVQMFRNVDSDMNGIINEEELYSLVSMFDVYSSDEIDQSFAILLNAIDPYHIKQMTFSQIVLALSSEFVFVPSDNLPEEMIKISLLDKIAMQT